MSTGDEWDRGYDTCPWCGGDLDYDPATNEQWCPDIACAWTEADDEEDDEEDDDLAPDAAPPAPAARMREEGSE